VTAPRTGLRVAACAYPIERVASLAAWRRKLDGLLAEAAAGGATLAVLPEYAAMELTALMAPDVRDDLAAQLAAMQDFLPAYVEAYAAAARRHRLHVLAGSFPELVDGAVGAGPGEYRNRARLFAPSGDCALAEKLQMTRFERERWGVSPGAAGAVIDSAFGTIGVAICYDAEFPLLVRRLTEAGAAIVLVPSCTDTLAGHARVRVACAARALESQCYVVQAPTVGFAPWAPAVDENHGAAAIHAPPDRGFPDDGVIAMGALDEPGWTFADLDLAALEAVRADGQVLNHRDWSAAAHLAAPIARTSLR
jgi:predicted amidohydrolase